MQIDLIPSAVALLVAMGGGAGLTKFVEGMFKIRSGMSAKESQRKVDIVTQRDAAIARENRAWSLVDAEAGKRREAQEYASRLRRQLIEAGIEPGAAPVFEQTITRAELTQLRGTKE